MLKPADAARETGVVWRNNELDVVVVAVLWEFGGVAQILDLHVSLSGK
jgi:hypothetical protein